jgi:mannonate dehydratase
VRLAVHPDDPPRPILGLPRIVSTIEDMQWLKETVDSIYNGFTMCTGSYGVRADNDLVRMIETFGDRIHFTHLRATCREENPKTFHEAAHLGGDVNMVAVVDAILAEERVVSRRAMCVLFRSVRITVTRCWTICVRKPTQAIRRLAV